MIHCACLLSVVDEKILLVRVRDNELWYLPGGTIEPGEAPEETLFREVKEELGVKLDRASIEFDRMIVGPALGRRGLVELSCFHAAFHGTPTPQAEVSEVAYLDLESEEQMAPAVKILVSDLRSSAVQE